MDVIMRMHAILPIWHTHRGKDKKQVQLALNMYFDKLMWMVTSTHFEISIDTMHEYVTGTATLKKMMRMLSDELDRGAILVYPDTTGERAWFQKDDTIERTDTITDGQAWNQFTTIDHHNDVKALVLPQRSRF